jgi:hypothetical protein
MPIYQTQFSAMHDGELKDFYGPVVPGDNPADAQRFCEENALGFCQVQPDPIRELPKPLHGGSDLQAILIAFLPEEASLTIAALKTVERTAMLSPMPVHDKLWVQDLARRAWRKITGVMTTNSYQASEEAYELLRTLYKPNDIRPDRDYRSCMTMTDIVMDHRFYTSVYAALVAVRYPGATWPLEMTEKEMAAVLPYTMYAGTLEEWRERHMARLRAATLRKFEQEPYRSLLLQEQHMMFIDIDAGPTYVDAGGEVKTEPVDMTDILTEIREKIEHGQEEQL